MYITYILTMKNETKQMAELETTIIHYELYVSDIKFIRNLYLNLSKALEKSGLLTTVKRRRHMYLFNTYMHSTTYGYICEIFY